MVSSLDMPQPLDDELDAVDTINAAALGMAKRWKLVRSDGEIACMREGCSQVATLPTLLCTEHVYLRRFDVTHILSQRRVPSR